MTFCNQLHELLRLAEQQVKREIIQTCIRTLSYNGETLKIVKNGAGNVLLLEPLNILYHIATSNEYQYIEDSLLKFVA